MLHKQHRNIALVKMQYSSISDVVNSLECKKKLQLQLSMYQSDDTNLVSYIFKHIRRFKDGYRSQG